MNAKIYVFVGIITSLLLYAIEFFDRNEVVKAWLTAQENKAAAFGLGRAVAGFIVRPVIYMIDGPIGAVIGGIIWPVVIFWLILLLFGISWAFLAPAFIDARCTADYRC